MPRHDRVAESGDARRERPEGFAARDALVLRAPDQQIRSFYHCIERTAAQFELRQAWIDQRCDGIGATQWCGRLHGAREGAGIDSGRPRPLAKRRDNTRRLPPSQRAERCSSAIARIRGTGLAMTNQRQGRVRVGVDHPMRSFQAARLRCSPGRGSSINRSLSWADAGLQRVSEDDLGGG